ncbi:MAG: histidine phosphatase family protein [Deltaproteobacteria bacterium]|uniref:histidine phosphatase family protein n=1 Tax=Desulfobacula sp. TaxID=2593537 RepID=UPI0019914A9B|nr:histidine phosphatase family protein [Candidatus Desulfobacula maris]MBL6992933.1 histidine phosphatase family protein [Desulfobacula sp.]
MSEIYLIRHGQASFGEKNYDRLSDKGVAQAAVLGRHLAALNLKFDAVCFGEMDRQQKTAQGMIEAYREKGLFVPEPEVDKSFNEYDATAVWEAQVGQLLKEDSKFLLPIEKEPKNNAAFQEVFSKVVARWVSGKFDAKGDVIWKDFKQRVAGGLNALMEREGSSKRIAVFSSGGPISAAIQMAMELSDLKTIEISWQVINASVTKLKYNGEKVSLTGFNDITHLELTGDKTLLTYR